MEDHPVKTDAEKLKKVVMSSSGKAQRAVREKHKEQFRKSIKSSSGKAQEKLRKA